MRTVTAKFGGSSLADAAQFKKVKEIILADPARRFIVVSAPGKRFDGDIKVTDLLIEAWEKARAGQDFDEILTHIGERFDEIARGTGTPFDVQSELTLIRQGLLAMPYRDYALSRGEYLCARLMAGYLGREFVDPAFVVCFDREGLLDEDATREALRKRLEGLDGAVIAGFYGSRPDGAVQTFSRGGSDVTGALVADATASDLYENWTDVSGMLAADPRVVENPAALDMLSYRELRILSYMGASVLHTDAVKPVRNSGIPINIKNTNRPLDAGTMILPHLPKEHVRRAVTGVAGRKGLSVVQVEKHMVSDGAGFTAVLLDIFKNHRVPFEQCLTGIDTISIVIRSDLMRYKRAQILADIRDQLDPDVLNVHENLSMITVVGENGSGADDLTVKLLLAVANEGISISTINQGAGRLNLIIGVNEADYERAMRALYRAIAQIEA